jgi:hypothetical protein
MVTVTSDSGGAFTVAMPVPVSVGNGPRAIVVLGPAPATGLRASLLVQPTDYQGPNSPPFRGQSG